MSIFDRVVNRQGTSSQKYDLREKLFGDEKVTPLWVADMDLTSPPFVVSALYKRLEHTVLGYTTKSDSLCNAIIWWHREVHNYALQAQDILLSPSVMTSLSATLHAFSKPGDAVLVCPPVYGGFFEAIKRSGRELIEVPLLEEDGEYEIDQTAVASLFEKKRVALFLFCNPHNPSGRVWDEKVLRNVLNLCLCYHVTIFSDEIHSDLVFSPAKHIPLLSLPGAEEVVITAHSIGKTFNLSGLNSSYVYTPNRKLRYKLLQSLKAAHVDDINLLGKIAIEAAYSWRGQNYRRDLLHYLRKNIALVTEKITPFYPKIKMMKPEAGFLLWFDFRESGLSHDEVKRKLVEDAHLGLTNGTFFGTGGEGFFRMNIAMPRMVLEDVLKRFIAFLATV